MNSAGPEAEPTVQLFVYKVRKVLGPGFRRQVCLQVREERLENTFACDILRSSQTLEFTLLSCYCAMVIDGMFGTVSGKADLEQPWPC